jgi:hypothetical protein
MPKVIIVNLRRPRLNKLDEMRDDPFWEFGSFGCTGCHKKNLMNVKKIHLLKGLRFAFAQGGNGGFKLVHLTPPVETHAFKNIAEVKWRPIRMPFKYEDAPLLINNEGKSTFPLLKKYISDADRSTWEGKFSSKFRSRRKPLDDELSSEIIEVYKRRSSNAKLFALKYVEALPYSPPKIYNSRRQRRQAYISILSRLTRQGKADINESCHAESGNRYGCRRDKRSVIPG